MNKKKTGKNKR